MMEHPIMMWPTSDNDPNDRNRQRFRHRDHGDLQLAYLIVEELVADARVADQPIGVEVRNGVVVLTGTVDTPETRDLVGDTVRQTGGVVDICNALQVTAPADTRPTHHSVDPSSDQRFQEIVAPLTAARRASPRDIPAARRFPALSLFLGVITWGALTILVVWLGWAGAVLAGAVAMVIATFVHHRESDSRR
jgi:hypothetical protein